MQEGKIKVGIGFATGRKSFQKVLRTYIYNLLESGLVDNKKISINLFVAYDLKYHRTSSISELTDNLLLRKEMVVMAEKELLQKIQKLRRTLNNFALDKSLFSPEVVELSQRLDSLLNQYYRCRQIA